jgi:hypothetical protein
MMRGGVRLSTFPSHVSRHPRLQATWQLDPAAMHGGVQFICPAMYDGEVKRTSFKNIFKYGPDPKICFKFGLKKMADDDLGEVFGLVPDDELEYGRLAFRRAGLVPR